MQLISVNRIDNLVFADLYGCGFSACVVSSSFIRRHRRRSAMATDFLAQLDPDFAAVVRQVLAATEAKGITMRPNSAARSPWEQAKLWRQSRSTEQIRAAGQQMKDEGAPWLADVLAAVGPQHGDHVTNALPGKSAHQYRLAVDCFWLRNGEAEWQDMTGYRIYATQAQSF